MSLLTGALKRAWRTVAARPFFWKAAVLAVFAVYFLLRALFISAESPYSLCGYMSPWIDEAAYTFTVRDLILNDHVPQDTDEAYYYFLKNTPGYQMLQLGFGRLFGVSYASIRMAGVLLNTLGLVMLYLLAARIAGRRTALVAAALMSFNYLAIMYGRLALTHSFAVPLFCICMYFWFRAYGRPWWALFAGGVWCITYFTNQLSVVFIAVLGCWWLLSLKRANMKKRLMLWMFFAGGVLLMGTLLLSVYFYDLTLGDIYAFLMHNFFRRQSADKPSLWIMLQRLVEPSQMLFFGRLPFVTCMAFAGALFALWQVLRTPAAPLPLGVYMSVWVGIHLVFLALFGYRPIRYHYYLLPPMVLLAATVLVRLWRADGRAAPGPVNRLYLVFVFGLSWLFAHFIGTGWLVRIGAGGVAGALLAAMAVTGAVYLAAYRYPFTKRAGRGAVLVLIALTAWYNLRPYADWVGSRTYRTVDSGRNMGMAVGAGACAGMLGSLSNVFGAESRIREVSYGISFGDRRVTPEYSLTKMLRNAPVTHLLMRRDKKEFHRAWAAALPDMYAGKVLVGTYMYKTFMVDLFMVHNPYGSSAYEPTPFERGREFESQKNYTEAVQQYRLQTERRPGHAEAWFRLGMLVSRTDAQRASEYFRKTVELLPRSQVGWRNLGALLLASGDRKGAVAAWEHAFTVAPQDRRLRDDIRKLKVGMQVKPVLYRGNPFM